MLYITLHIFKLPVTYLSLMEENVYKMLNNKGKIIELYFLLFQLDM